MSEELEQHSVCTLVKESDIVRELKDPSLSPPKLRPVRNQCLHHRLQLRKCVASQEPHYVRSRSKAFSDQIPDQFTTTDGRSKAAFCMATSCQKNEAERNAASTISLYAKMVNREEVMKYVARERNKHPEARCIYVPKRVRYLSSSLPSLPDSSISLLRAYRPHVLSTAILPPLKVSSLKTLKDP